MEVFPKVIPNKSLHDLQEIRENLAEILKEFYAKPQFTPSERSIVWRLAVAVDSLQQVLEGFGEYAGK